jgi:hypothetical protein
LSGMFPNLSNAGTMNINIYFGKWMFRFGFVVAEKVIVYYWIMLNFLLSL